MSDAAGACICEEVLEDMDYWNIINLEREIFRYKCTKVPVQFVGQWWWLRYEWFPTSQHVHITWLWVFRFETIEYKAKTSLYPCLSHPPLPLSNTTRTCRFVCSHGFSTTIYPHLHLVLAFQVSMIATIAVLLLDHRLHCRSPSTRCPLP